jgi:hypothetical protein
MLTQKRPLTGFESKEKKISKPHFKLIAKDNKCNIIALLLKLKAKRGQLLLAKHPYNSL